MSGFFRRSLSSEICLVWAVCLFVYACPSALFSKSESPPSFKEVQSIFARLWEERYPLRLESVQPDPQNKGVLQVLHKKESSFYYRFKVSFKKPYRLPEEEKLSYGKTTTAEVWVRYRPLLKDAYDITFAREDLLPGKNRRWLKIFR